MDGGEPATCDGYDNDCDRRVDEQFLGCCIDGVLDAGCIARNILGIAALSPTPVPQVRPLICFVSVVQEGQALIDLLDLELTDEHDAVVVIRTKCII